MLDPARANAKTAAINAAFEAIGIANGTGMPRSKRNDEHLAYEYHVASHLNRLAEARKKAAVRACVKAGVMFDPEKSPLVEGTNSVVYAGEVVEISVSVTTPATRLDMEPFAADLVKLGIAQARLTKLTEKHTVANRAPHKFISTLVTG